QLSWRSMELDRLLLFQGSASRFGMKKGAWQPNCQSAKKLKSESNPWSEGRLASPLGLAHVSPSLLKQELGPLRDPAGASSLATGTVLTFN
ncbi:hypothetical protein LRQ20_08315, partial [Pseudomonas sp. MAFF 311096]